MSRLLHRQRSQIEQPTFCEVGGGPPPIDPKILMALWLYATIEGLGSRRHLDKLCGEHAAFQ